METKMTKAEKLLAKAVAACGDNESVLVVYSGAEDGNVAMCGDPNEIAVGVAHIMANGVRENASDDEKKLANSILNGIYKVLAEGDRTAVSMVKTIDHVVREAKDEIAKRNKKKHNGSNHGHSAPEEFDPRSKDCITCEDFRDCAMRWLSDRINDAMRDNNNGNVKKTKKARKHGNRK